MNIEQIKQFLRENHYFLYRDGADKNLAQKTSENEFRILDKEITAKFLGKEYVMSPLALLEFKVNATVLDPLEYIALNEMLDVVDFKVYRKYDERESQIAKNKQVISKIKKGKGFFQKNPLIRVKHQEYTNGNLGSKYFIVNLNKKLISPFDESLVEDPSSAIEFNNISIVKNAINDSMQNQYESEYQAQLDKWHALG